MPTAAVVLVQSVQERQDLTRYTDSRRGLTNDVSAEIVVVVGAVTAVTEVEPQFSDPPTGLTIGIQISRPNTGMWVSSRAPAAIISKAILDWCEDSVVASANRRSEGCLIGLIGHHTLGNGKKKASIEPATILGRHDLFGLNHIDVQEPFGRGQRIHPPVVVEPIQTVKGSGNGKRRLDPGEEG